MLFTYHYVNHSIEQLQVYTGHLVKEVWCKAEGDFSLDLLEPELREIVEEIFNTEEGITRGKIGDWLYGPIKKIYNMFKDLEPAQRQQISTWYDHNNDIQALCACDPNKTPATYDDIAAINADLGTALHDFCRSLFTNIIDLQAIRSRIGDINDHYEAFVTHNAIGKCPYCGCSEIKGKYQTRREAYDHFLPKGTYPFNSVNFRNLAPMCHDCNSSYKLKKDPIRLKNSEGGADYTRRKAFFSYDDVAPDISITVTLKTGDVTNLGPANIDLQFVAPAREEEVETWKDVFGIEERYKAKLSANNDGRVWLQKILEEAENAGLTREQLLEYELRAAKQYPYSDANFLKAPFLRACRDAKIFERSR